MRNIVALMVLLGLFSVHTAIADASGTSSNDPNSILLLPETAFAVKSCAIDLTRQAYEKIFERPLVLKKNGVSYFETGIILGYGLPLFVYRIGILDSEDCYFESNGRGGFSLDLNHCKALPGVKRNFDLDIKWVAINATMKSSDSYDEFHNKTGTATWIDSFVLNGYGTASRTQPLYNTYPADGNGRLDITLDTLEYADCLKTQLSKLAPVSER